MVVTQKIEVLGLGFSLLRKITHYSKTACPPAKELLCFYAAPLGTGKSNYSLKTKQPGSRHGWQIPLEERGYVQHG